MSKKEEIKKSLENEINFYDEILDDTKRRVELSPYILDRKKEAEAKIFFVNQAPEELLEEVGDKFLVVQKSEEEELKKAIAGLGKVYPEVQRYLASGTSDSSAYLGMAETLETYVTLETGFEWTGPVLQTFSDLADEKAKKEYLPKRLNKFSDNLGKMFTVAQQNVEKSRGNLVGVDQAAIQMRDVLQQIWGFLANLTREKCPSYKDSKLELGKEKHREFVIECLGIEEVSRIKLVSLLEEMAAISKEISGTQFGKNPLTTDVEKLNKINRRWILVIDDIVNYLYRNLKIDD